jgi:hypothetical protein
VCEEISVVVACKPMWQNMRVYQTIANNRCSHINAELLLVSMQYSLSYNSQIKRSRTHVDMGIFFFVFSIWNSRPKFFCELSVTSYIKMAEDVILRQNFLTTLLGLL